LQHTFYAFVISFTSLIIWTSLRASAPKLRHSPLYLPNNRLFIQRRSTIEVSA